MRTDARGASPNDRQRSRRRQCRRGGRGLLRLQDRPGLACEGGARRRSGICPRPLPARLLLLVAGPAGAARKGHAMPGARRVRGGDAARARAFPGTSGVVRRRPDRRRAALGASTCRAPHRPAGVAPRHQLLLQPRRRPEPARQRRPRVAGVGRRHARLRLCARHVCLRPRGMRRLCARRGRRPPGR